MNPQPVRVLLVDEDPAEARRIRSLLADPQEMTCDLQTAATCAGFARGRGPRRGTTDPFPAG